MQKVFLTLKGNVLAQQQNGKYAFFTPTGTFLRECAETEAEYLFRILTPLEAEDGAFTKTVLPVWHFLWSTLDEDYSKYEASRSSNGGAYAHFTKRYFFVDTTGERPRYRVYEKQWSSCDAGFQDYRGQMYYRPDEATTLHLCNTFTPFEVVKIGAMFGPDGTQLHDADAVLEAVSVESSFTEAFESCNTRDGIETPPTMLEIQKRAKILNALGLVKEHNAIMMAALEVATNK